MSFELPPPRIKKWTRKSTRRAADFPVFGVDEHEIIDGDGKPRKNVFTFVCRDWCNVIAVTPARELVMLWQYRFGTDRLSLEIPGGVIEPGEEPIAAAARELTEETGYTARTVSLLSSIEANPAIQDNVLHSFVAEDLSQDGATNFDELEECEVALVPIADLPRFIDDGTIRHALVVAALETFLRKHPLAK